MTHPADPFAEPVDTAKAAALRYVSDAGPGIRRRRSGKGFSYRAVDGGTLHDKATLDRIRALAIPPAWRAVWICPLAEGHLQATGRDARGRKQYRYHQRWRQLRDETKYERLLVFGATLPRLRTRVRKDLALSGLQREKVLATIVRLLGSSLIRVGNEEYARHNRSFGLTTLRNRHVKIQGATLRFRFSGKSGKFHTVDVSDRRLAQLVRRCRELPGQDLFQYLDEAGEPQPIDSGAVNDYLRLITGQDFTAKDFRTWAGTLLAARLLTDGRTGDRADETPLGAAAAAAAVAQQLGNTPAICRKCYIHPAVLAAHQNRGLLALWRELYSNQAPRRGLAKDEATLLEFLRRCSGHTLVDLLQESVAIRQRAAAHRSAGRAAAVPDSADGAARRRAHRYATRPARARPGRPR